MLDSKQRAYLRSLASHIETIFQVGKGGVGDNMTSQLSDALEARELIKIHVLENCTDDIASVADSIALATSSQVVCVIGNRIVLYRESVKHKKIDLSSHSKSSK